MDKYYSAFPCEKITLERHQANIRDQTHRDASLDDALGCTFPASDPVALDYSVTTLLGPAREHLRVTIEFFKHARPRIPS